MNDPITHFCDFNAPQVLKDAIVDHSKLNELCRTSTIKQLRRYLSYVNPQRRVETVIIESEIEEKKDRQVIASTRVAAIVSVAGAVAAILSAYFAGVDALSASKSASVNVHGQSAPIQSTTTPRP